MRDNVRYVLAFQACFVRERQVGRVLVLPGATAHRGRETGTWLMRTVWKLRFSARTLIALAGRRLVEARGCGLRRGGRGIAQPRDGRGGVGSGGRGRVCDALLSHLGAFEAEVSEAGNGSCGESEWGEHLLEQDEQAVVFEGRPLVASGRRR